MRRQFILAATMAATRMPVPRAGPTYRLSAIPPAARH